MNNRNSSHEPTFECSVHEVQKFVAYLIWKRYFWSERKASEDKNMDDVCLNLLHKVLETQHKENNRKIAPASGQQQGYGKAWVFDHTDTITLHFSDFESKVVWDYVRARIPGRDLSAVRDSVQQINVKTFKQLKENIEIAVKKMENVGVFDNEPAFLGFSHMYNQLLGLLYETASVEIWYHDLEMCMVDEETKKVLQMWVPTEFLRSLEKFEKETGIVLYDWDNAEKVEVEELEKKSVAITSYYLINALENRYDKEKKRLFTGYEAESDKYPINICRYAIMFSQHSNKGNSVYINKTALDQVDKCVSYIKLTPQYEELIKKVVEETNFAKLKNFFERNLVELNSTNLVEAKDFSVWLAERLDLYKMFCLLSCSAFRRQAFLILVAFNDIFEALVNLTLGDTKNMLDLPVKEFAEQDWMANFNKLFQAEKCETLADVWNAMVYAFQDTVFTYDLLREGLYEPTKHNFSATIEPSKIERMIHDKLTFLSKITGLGNIPHVEEKPEDEAENDRFSPEDDSCGHHCHLCAARKNCPEYNGHDCYNCPVRFICRTYREKSNKDTRISGIVIFGRK